MVTGGIGKVDSTEYFDPATGTWSEGSRMVEPRYRHTATVLQDGTVLLVGGQSKDKISNGSEVYEQ
jgi:hypothetical protein